MNFEISREVFGELKSFELIPGGDKVPVTLKNKCVSIACNIGTDYNRRRKGKQNVFVCRQQYIDLYVDYVLNKSVETQYKAFHNGFHSVCGGRVLELFRSHELMSLLIGNENYDWEELETNASYKDGYSKSDSTIVLFWQVFHELPLEEKKKFLLFLTGSDRIPIQGMKAIKVRKSDILAFN